VGGLDYPGSLIIASFLNGFAVKVCQAMVFMSVDFGPKGSSADGCGAKGGKASD